MMYASSPRGARRARVGEEAFGRTCCHSDRLVAPFEAQVYARFMQACALTVKAMEWDYAIVNTFAAHNPQDVNRARLDLHLAMHCLTDTYSTTASAGSREAASLSNSHMTTGQSFEVCGRR